MKAVTITNGENSNSGFSETTHPSVKEEALDPPQETSDDSGFAQSGRNATKETPDAVAKRSDRVDALFKDLTRRQNFDAVVKKGWQNPLAGHNGPTIYVYQENCLEALESMEMGIIDEHDRARTATLVKCILSRGVQRMIKPIPNDWKQQLELLEKDHPNFSNVVEYLRSVFALAAATDKILRMDPILLAGSPGVGKSLFAARFANLIEIPSVCIRMENSQTNATLVGADRFWSNAKPGKILEQLVYGEYANPIFYLDEIDKISTEKYDSTSALYSLLEPNTAKQFTDLCFPFLTLDASHITWVATCNDKTLLPLPLLSRFKIFDIDMPKYDEALQIVEKITNDIQNEYSKAGLKIHFSPEVSTTLVLHSPRRMQQLIREAIGRALYAGRWLVTGTDIKTQPPVKRGIGFH